MTICVTASAGGAGATVAAATIALSAPGGATLVDLAGDLAAALGLGDDLLGVEQWLATDAPTERLDELLEPVGTTGVDLLPWTACGTADGPGGGVPPDGRRWSRLLSWCALRHRPDRPVVVDTGLHHHHVRGAADELGGGVELTSVLVTRACYLALRRRHLRPADRPDAVVVVREPGRSLTARDVASAVGAPVVASTTWDPAVARAVDAGVIAARLPASARRTGRSVLAAVDRTTARREVGA